MKPINGKILKCVGGFYYVRAEDGAVHECRARGLFRLQGITPVAGDNVSFTPQRGGETGYVETVSERVNELKRPAAANVDALLIVISAGKPKPDLLLADKLLLYAAKNGITPAICVNKADTLGAEQAALIAASYRRSGAELLIVSAATGAGREQLADFLRGRTTCLAGQSAVGKSSIINMFIEDGALETGGLSRKTERGRHTTRVAELFYIDELNGAVMDTPGFSILETFTMEPAELAPLYADFAPYAGGCRFDTCLHDREPDCAVKNAVRRGEIDKERYLRYRALLTELREKHEHRYD